MYRPWSLRAARAWGESFLTGRDLPTREGPTPFRDAARRARARSSAESERRTARRWFRTDEEAADLAWNDPPRVGSLSCSRTSGTCDTTTTIRRRTFTRSTGVTRQ